MAGLVSKKINKISKSFADELIKRSPRPVSLFQRVDLEKEIARRIRLTLKKRATIKDVTTVAKKVIRKKGFVKGLIDKLKKGEKMFRKKVLTKQPQRKVLKKIVSRKKVITLKEIQREATAKALSNKVKRVSELFADKIIRSKIVKQGLFTRSDLERRIAEHLRRTMKGKKVITIKGVQREGRILFSKRKVLKSVVDKAKKDKVVFKVTRIKPKRTIKTIKDFPDKAVKGFQEVRSRGMVLLQKTKQIQKQATKQKMVLKQKLKFKNVSQIKAVSQKLRVKNVSLKNQLVSLSKVRSGMIAGLVLLKSANASVMAQKSAQALKSASESASKSVSSSISANASVLASAQMFLQASKSASRQRAKTIKVTKKKEKKVRVPIRLPGKKKKVVKAGKFPGYVVKFRSKGRVISSKVPLSLKDAKDILAYRIDRRLIRTGKVVPVGKVKRLGKVQKGISGAFEKRKHKLRVFRLKKKKKVKYSTRRFIEKKKYVGDTKSEQRLLKQARAKAKKHRKRTKKRR